ncbi:hypothetical protein ACTD5D_15655 [Nocardia takedensis]|uniref:hypothetical protein n=1 Tax=Nocardia takedensis TaxID=259390 RepID=UPI0002FA301F|nr:hypothetical protein [Nocardia takedensis]
MPLTRDDLIGYIDRDLDDDLARWFAGSPAVDISDEPVRAVEPFLTRLSPADAAALAAFDRRVRSGTMPQFLDIYSWSYGFDFAGNECEILDSDYATELTDADLYSLGADGGGNLYVLLHTGQVALWFHEEQVVEGHTCFDDLDTFVWSMVRYHAVRAGELTPLSVEAEFLALAQDGMLEPEVGLLRTLR